MAGCPFMLSLRKERMKNPFKSESLLPENARYDTADSSTQAFEQKIYAANRKKSTRKD